MSVGIYAASGAVGGGFARFSGNASVSSVDKLVNAASGGVVAGGVDTATNIRLGKKKRFSADGCGCP